MNNKIMKCGILLVLLCLCLVGCSKTKEVEDLNQSSVKIGVEYGTLMEENLDAVYPKATKVYVNSISEGVQELLAGQIDALLEDTVEVRAVAETDPSLEIADEEFPITNSVIVAISKNTKIPGATQMVNDFLNEIKADGTLEDMSNRWEVENDYNMPDIPEAADPIGTIIAGTTGLAEPYTFYSNNELTGFDIELAKRFAYWANYDIEFEIYDWNGIYSAVSSNNVDFGFSDLYYQEDSTDIIDVSEPYLTVTCSLLLKNESNVSFIDTFKNQFYNNFIKEDRWMMLVSGLRVTLTITILTAIFGCILGFVIALGKMSKKKWLRNLLDRLTLIIKSIPLLVLLLIFYYAIFRNLNNLSVTVIAFSINFGVFISDTFVTSIEGIDKGQWEVAQTLGFSKKDTFMVIIMPQALKTFLPAYLSSIISMMLLTSVVGYISLVDITFAAQMIRARTYNAVYTLVATAIIYLIIASLMNRLFKWCEKKLFTRDPLKGINTDFETSAFMFRKENKENDHETIIEVKDLIKKYGNSTIIDHLNCEVKRGEVVSIIGPSGTGKSTLLRCINRLEEATEGSIRLFGEEVSKGKPDQLRSVLSRTGMVFQSFYLFDHLTIIENVMIAQTLILKKPKQEAYEMSMNLLSALGLKESALKMPEALSGGQKQRVAIARALAMEPEILLFDEPTSALDPNLVGEVIYVINKLARTGMTMLVVTHQMNLVKAISNRVFYLDQGIVYEEGTPDEIFNHPKKDRCRIFVHELKTMTLEFAQHDIDSPSMIEAIDEFTDRYELSKEVHLKLYQIIDELVLGMILPMAYEKGMIHVEYEEDISSVHADISYEGKACNILKIKDENYDMNIRLILDHVKKTDYKYEDDTNIISLWF